jgi:hypothetical protein
VVVVDDVVGALSVVVGIDAAETVVDVADASATGSTADPPHDARVTQAAATAAPTVANDRLMDAERNGTSVEMSPRHERDRHAEISRRRNRGDPAPWLHGITRCPNRTIRAGNHAIEVSDRHDESPQ